MADRDNRFPARSSIAEAMAAENGKVDVLIGGAGFAGLSLGIALRQALGPSFKVAIADPALDRGGGDPRASAIVAAARRMFEAIGVWDTIAEGAQPILDMVVTDLRLNDAVRPTFLSFDGDVEPGEPFAHMIENGPLLAALLAKAREVGVELLSSAIQDFAHRYSADPHPTLPLSGGREDFAARPCRDVSSSPCVYGRR